MHHRLMILVSHMKDLKEHIVSGFGYQRIVLTVVGRENYPFLSTLYLLCFGLLEPFMSDISKSNLIR